MAKWIETAEEFYSEWQKRKPGDFDMPFFDDDDAACSECLEQFNCIDNEANRFKYCPACGEKMEE